MPTFNETNGVFCSFPNFFQLTETVLFFVSGTTSRANEFDKTFGVKIGLNKLMVDHPAFPTSSFSWLARDVAKQRTAIKKGKK